MDIIANQIEQGNIAQAIIDLQDDAVDAGYEMAELTEIAELAERLAELVIAAAEWQQKTNR